MSKLNLKRKYNKPMKQNKKEQLNKKDKKVGRKLIVIRLKIRKELLKWNLKLRKQTNEKVIKLFKEKIIKSSYYKLLYLKTKKNELKWKGEKNKKGIKESKQN